MGSDLHTGAEKSLAAAVICYKAEQLTNFVWGWGYCGGGVAAEAASVWDVGLFGWLVDLKP